MKFLIATLAFSSALATDAAFAQRISYAFDSASGYHVKLENLDRRTRVTDLRSGDSVVVEGELAGVVSDTEYAKIMRIKRDQRSHRQNLDSDPTPRGQARPDQRPSALATAAAITTQCSGSFSISGGTGGWDSPLCYFTKTSTVSLSGKATSNSSKSFSITLYKDIPFWTDQSYGTRTYTATSQGYYFSGSWSPVEAGKYYYLRLSTTYDGRSVYGNYVFAQ